MLESPDLSRLLLWLDRSALHCVQGGLGSPSLQLGGLQVLQALASINDTDALSVAKEVNKITLLVSRSGHYDRALALLELTIKTCKSQFQSTFDPTWLEAAIQPYINALRLRAMKGETDLVIRMLLGLYTSMLNDSLVEFIFSEKSTTKPLCTRSFMSAHEQSVICNACIADGIKACLITQAAPMLGQVIGEWRGKQLVGNFGQRVLMEGAVCLALLNQEYSVAVRRVDELWDIARNDAVPDPTLLCYLLWAYVRSRREGAAEKTAKILLGYAMQLRARGQISIAKRLSYRLALFHTNLGMAREAINCAQLAVELSTEQDDVVVRDRSRMILSVFAEDKNERITGRFSLLCEGSGYIVERYIATLMDKVTDGLLSEVPKEIEITQLPSKLSVDLDLLTKWIGYQNIEELDPILAFAYKTTFDRVSEIGGLNAE